MSLDTSMDGAVSDVILAPVVVLRCPQQCLSPPYETVIVAPCPNQLLPPSQVTGISKYCAMSLLLPHVGACRVVVRPASSRHFPRAQRSNSLPSLRSLVLVFLTVACTATLKAWLQANTRLLPSATHPARLPLYRASCCSGTSQRTFRLLKPGWQFGLKL